MGIFDQHTSNATATYTFDDGTHVEFGRDDYAPEPEPGEYRLMSFDGKDLAVGSWQRFGEEFWLGDEDLFELYHEWEDYEECPDDFDEEPSGEKPTLVSLKGYSQGDEIFVYFPADSTDTDEQKETSAQLLANYAFGDIYIAEVTDPDGEVRVSYSIEDKDVKGSPVTFKVLDGYGASEDEVRAALDTVGWRED